MIRSLRAASSSAGMNACSRPRPCTTSASARLSFVTKLGLTGTLCGSWVPSAIVSTETRSPPIWRAMSATSGNAATTRSFASAAGAPNTEKRPGTRTRCALALSEAMAVTPEECGPLNGVTLVGRLIAPGRVELEAQALELRRHPGDERGARTREVVIVGAHQVDDLLQGLRVVEPRPDGEAAIEERLCVPVAAFPIRAVSERHDGDPIVEEHIPGHEFLAPVPLRPDHEALIDAARARLMAQREVDAIEVALVLLRHPHPGAPELGVERVGDVEVGVRARQHRELAEIAPASEAVVVQVAQALGSHRVVEAAGQLDELIDR